jgi:hypothetical protein
MKIFLHPDPTDRKRWMSTIRLLEAMLRNHWQPATVEDLFPQTVPCRET